MSTSSDVTAGTNATATEYNNLRSDAIIRERVYVFEIKGALVTGDEQGPRYIVPAGMTVTKIKHKITSGTSATFRVQKDTTDIKNSISATSSVTTETSITSASLVVDQVLSLDITAVSGSPVDLLVEVITTENI
jgi:hypothetical protein